MVHNVHHYEENGLFDDHFDWDLAIAFLELEDYEQAAASFEKAFANYKDNPDFLFDYAQFLIEEGRQKEAVKHLEKILSLDATLAPARELLENLM